MFQQSPVTFILIAANVLFSIVGFSNQSFMDKTILWPYYVKKNNEYYRMITSGFLHADWMHLFFNMFTLYFFGRNIEYEFSKEGLGGNISYLLLYFGALVISDLPTVIKHRDDYHYKALGASGAVSAVVFAAIVFNPWSSVYLYGALKISFFIYAVLFIIYCMYMGKKSADNVNHDAHLWGALFGLALTLILVFINNPELMNTMIEKFKNPSIFGHNSNE